MKKFARITTALAVTSTMALSFTGCAYFEPSTATEYEDYVIYGGEATGVASLDPHLGSIYDEAEDSLKLVDTAGSILGVFTTITLDSMGVHRSRETTPEDLGQWDSTSNIFFATKTEAQKAVKTLSSFYTAQGYELRGSTENINGNSQVSLVRTNESRSSSRDVISITVLPTPTLKQNKLVYDVAVRTLTEEMKFSDLPVLAGKLTAADIEQMWGTNPPSTQSCDFVTQDNVTFNSPWGGWLDDYGCLDVDAPIQAYTGSSGYIPSG